MSCDDVHVFGCPDVIIGPCWQDVKISVIVLYFEVVAMNNAGCAVRDYGIADIKEHCESVHSHLEKV